MHWDRCFTRTTTFLFNISFFLLFSVKRELVYLLLYSCEMYITIGASIVTFNFCILWCNIRGPSYGEGF